LKKFCSCEKNCERLPPVLVEVVVRAKGWKLVPLNRTAEAFPNPGTFNAPVSMSVWLADTSDDESWFLVSGRTWRPRIVVPLPKTSPTEFHVDPSYFIKKAEPFVAVPDTQSSDTSPLAAVSADTGPGMISAPVAVDHVWAFAL